MKKLLLILLCLPMIGFGQQSYISTDSLLYVDSVITENNGALLVDMIKRQKIYRNGNKDRFEMRTYYQGLDDLNTSVFVVVNAETGDYEVDGSFKSYYRSGKIEIKGQMRMGKCVRKFYMFYKSGKRKKIIRFSKEGSEFINGAESVECFDENSNLIDCEGKPYENDERDDLYNQF